MKSLKNGIQMIDIEIGGIYSVDTNRWIHVKVLKFDKWSATCKVYFPNENQNYVWEIDRARLKMLNREKNKKVEKRI